jgi:hypothetical protein
LKEKGKNIGGSSLKATTFRSIKAHGMHLRICSTEEEKTTCDSSIAIIFFQPKRGIKDDAHVGVLLVE